MTLDNKFMWAKGDLKPVVPRQCTRCAHLRSSAVWTCDAFPNGIPAAILTNKHDHTKPYPGDKGIRFDPIDDTTVRV